MLCDEGIIQILGLQTMTKNDKRLNAFFIALIVLSTILVALPVITYPVIASEVLISFRLPVSIVLFIIFIIFIIRRLYWMGAVQMLLLACNIWPVLGVYSFSNSKNTCVYDRKVAPFRVMSFNTYYKNNDYEDIYQNISHADADVVVLQEAQPGFTGYSHDRLAIAYPFYYPNFEQGKHDRWTLYSRYPIISYDKKKFKGAALHAQIQVENRVVNIVTIHAKSPKNIDRIMSRNMRIKKLSEVIRGMVDSNRYVIVAGDFNNVPWHPVMRDFKSKTKLRSNDITLNYFGTWPTWLPSFVSTPIDHIFYDDSFRAESYIRRPHSGSDHYPIVADLNFCE